MERNRKILGFLFCVCLFAVPLYFGWNQLKYHVYASSFDAKEVRAYAEVEIPRMARLDNRRIPHRSGKVVLVVPGVWMTDRTYNTTLYATTPADGHRFDEVEPPHLDDDWALLSPTVRASDATEVDTIIICERGGEKLGYYRGKAEKLGIFDEEKESVLLRVYDVKRGAFAGDYLLMADEAGERPDLVDFVENRMPVQ